MFLQLQTVKERPFRAIDVALISLPAIPTATPNPTPAPTKKAAEAQPTKKVEPPSPAPQPLASPVENTLPPLSTETASERLSESLGGAINSIVVPQKHEVPASATPPQEPKPQPSEDQPPLIANLRLPSAPPTISRPTRLEPATPVNIPSRAKPTPTPVPTKDQAQPKPESLPSTRPAPTVQLAMKPAPAIPSLSEVTPFKQSLETPTSKSQPSPKIEDILKLSRPNLQMPVPTPKIPQKSRKPLTQQPPPTPSPTPRVSAPEIRDMPQPTQPQSSRPAPPNLSETVKKLMEGLKSTTRTPVPQPVPYQQSQPSLTIPPVAKPLPSAIDTRIAKLSIPEVAPVESIKQRLDQIQVQALSDTDDTLTSQQSPGENRYFAIIKKAIDSHWTNPEVPITNKKVIITFRVEKSGEISRVHVEQSSGNSYYDSTILGAINKANPLPKFPSDLQKSFLDIKFLFTMPEQ
ncbi:MAG: TonB family protein [Nitrospirota bacterium]|nr:TonB family protein [Nitrospirota bacterium]